MAIFRVTPVDTTGAGDSLNAGLIYSYLERKDKAEMLRFACACGALATLRIGGASAAPDILAIEDFMNSQI
jgi:sugar/nucleoside kinase (ribokinase family)